MEADEVAGVVGSPWEWEPRPDVWLVMGTLLFAYWWADTVLRRRQPTPPPPRSASQRGLFGLGVAVLWIAVDWPMDRLGDEFLFSAHMAQFLAVTMVAVPLLLRGVPVWLQAELVQPFGPVLARLRAPVALILYQVILVATHLPTVVAAYTSNEVVHFGLHLLWMASALVFWLPVLGEQPVYRPLSHPAKVAYLIAATIVPTVPASFLTWAAMPYYDSYAGAPRVWGISPIDDLQLAGLIMKLGGGAILWAYILWFFARWASSERDDAPHIEPVHSPGATASLPRPNVEPGPSESAHVLGEA